MLFVSLALRLPGVARPLTGNFATKNATYGMIARNFATGRASIWRPTTDCLAADDRGWHLVEFPVAAYFSGTGWRFLGGSLEIWGRGLSVVFGVASVFLIWSLANSWHGESVAWGAGWMMALSPVSVFLGQSFMLEASLVCFSLVAIWGADRYLIEPKRLWLCIAVAGFALAVLTKVYMVVLLAPLAAMAWPHAYGAVTRQRAAWLAAGLVLATIPAALWYADAYRTAAPENPLSPRVFDSFRRNVASHTASGSVLFSREFATRMLADLSTWSLTPLGFVCALAAFWRKDWRRHVPWLAAMSILVCVMPGKFLRLNYYQFVILPPLCLLVGLGWRSIHEHFAGSRWLAPCALSLGLASALRFAAGPSYITPSEDVATPTAGAAVRALAKSNEPVATLHGSSSDLLYYCDRPGWALSKSDPRWLNRLERCRLAGAQWLVVVGEGPQELSSLRVEQTGPGFRIFDLGASADLAKAPAGESSLAR